MLLCLTAFVNGQNATISGVVTNNLGDRVDHALIAIQENAQAVTYSDAKGNYQLTVESGKVLTLVVYELNHAKYTFTFEAKPGEHVHHSPMMTFRNELVTVEVTDFKSRSDESVRLDPKVFSQIPSTTGNIEDIIKTQMGVSSNNELSSGYSVRGGNFDENLVYVNDIEVYRPFLVRSGQQEGLSFANPAMVQNINFSAGGFEARYGDKLSSVLDITYRKASKFGGSASASLLGGNVQLEGVSNNRLLSWNVGARYRTNAYLLKSLDTEGEYNPSSMDIQSYLVFEISPKFRLEAFGNIAQHKYLVVPETRETTFGTVQNALRFYVAYDGQELMQYTTYMGALSATYRSGPKTRLKLITSAYRADEKELYTVQGQYWIDQLEADLGQPNFGQVAYNRGVGTFLNNGRNYLTANVYNIEHKGWHNFNHDNELTWGIREQFEKITDRLGEWRTLDSAGFLIPYSATQIDLIDVYKTRIELPSMRTQGYVQYNHTRTLADSSSLRLTGGVRANYWTVNGQTVVSPRITFAYKPNWRRDWLFKLSAGFYYQPPFYRELRDVRGQIHRDVKAQKSVHYVATADYIFRMWKRPFKLIFAGYYKELTAVNPYEVDNVRIRYFANNNSIGYATGADVRINGEFVKGVESWATIGVLSTKEYSKDNIHWVFYNADGDEIARNQAYEVVVDSQFVDPGYIPRPTDQLVTFGMFFQDYLPRYPAFKFNLNLQFGTGLPFGPPTHLRYQQVFRMPPYRRVDCGFAYNLLAIGREKNRSKFVNSLKEAWLFLEVFNLLAIQNSVSYNWLQDVTGARYAIPNYLTGRLVNVRLHVSF